MKCQVSGSLTYSFEGIVDVPDDPDVLASIDCNMPEDTPELVQIVHDNLPSMLRPDPELIIDCAELE